MKNVLIKPFLLKSLAVLTLVFVATVLDAQCPMCRMSAESNLANGGSEGSGLNKGILYLLSLPYLIVMVLGFIWFRHKKMNQQDQ